MSKTTNGATTEYLYSGANFVQEQNTTGISANLITSGIDEVFTRTTQAASRDYLRDALGSTLALVDPNAILSTPYTYSPYGASSMSGVTDTSSQTYTGREDDGTGLFYYQNRYYDPALGRFMQADPLGFADGYNLYAYVGNNPLSYVDPLGLWEFTVYGQGTGSAIVGVAVVGGGGIYIHYNSDDDSYSYGTFNVAGYGVGLDIGVAAQGGFVLGPMSNFCGWANAAGISVFKGGGGLNFDQRTVTGGFVGLSLGPLPLGSSITTTYTSIGSIIPRGLPVHQVNGF